MVCLGSIWPKRMRNQKETNKSIRQEDVRRKRKRKNKANSYDNSSPRVLMLLILRLSVDINAGEPAAVSRMGMIPANDTLLLIDPLERLRELDHELVVRHTSVDADLVTLRRMRKMGQ